MSAHRAPVFLLGHPKSGTTAIAGLLARATGLAVTHDLFKTYGFSRRAAADLIEGRTDMARFVKAHRYAFSTPLQKCPKLTFAYHALRSHFRDARFVAIVRHPHDTIRSFLYRRGLPGDALQLPRPLALLPERLSESQADHYIDRLACRWTIAADVALDHPDEVETIRYEDFERDKVGEITRLAWQLGLDAPYDISSWLNVAFKPVSHTGLSKQQFFGLENFARITRICSERMERLGYPVTRQEFEKTHA